MSAEFSQYLRKKEPEQEDFSQYRRAPKEERQIPGKELIPQAALGAAEAGLTAPGTIGEFLNRLIDVLPKGEKSAELRRHLGKVFFPQLSGETLQGIQQKEKQLFGEKLQPTTPSGRIGRRVGEFVGSTAATGGVSPASLIGAATSGAAGQGLRELGVPEEIATGAELISPLAGAGAAKVLRPIKEGALKSSLNQKQKAFYDEAKSLGLSDKEITPLLQSEKRVKTLGPFAKKTKAVQEALKETKGGIGEIYNPIKEKASSLGQISGKESIDLSDNLQKIADKMRKTHSPSADKEKALKFLDKAINDIENKGTSPEKLINFFQDINEQGLYEHLKPVKNEIIVALKKSEPKLAREFEFTNEMYSKLSQLRKKVGLGEWEKLLTFGKGLGLLGSLGSFVLFGSGLKGAAAVLGAELTRRIATKMLIDPRWQGILRNSAKAAKENSRSAGLVAYRQLKDKVKEDFPEEYEQIEWPES